MAILNDMVHAARAMQNTGAKPVQVDATADDLMDELSSFLGEQAWASLSHTCNIQHLLLAVNIYINIYITIYIYI